MKELVQQQIQELKPMRAPWYRSSPRRTRGGWRSQHHHQQQQQQQQEGAASHGFNSTTLPTTEVRRLYPLHACMALP